MGRGNALENLRHPEGCQERLRDPSLIQSLSNVATDRYELPVSYGRIASTAHNHAEDLVKILTAFNTKGPAFGSAGLLSEAPMILEAAASYLPAAIVGHLPKLLFTFAAGRRQRKVF